YAWRAHAHTHDTLENGERVTNVIGGLFWVLPRVLLWWVFQAKSAETAHVGSAFRFEAAAGQRAREGLLPAGHFFVEVAPVTPAFPKVRAGAPFLPSGDATLVEPAS